MARPHHLVATLVTAGAVAAAPAGAQDLAQDRAPASPLAGPHTLAAAGAVPRSAQRRLREETRRAEAAQPRRTTAAQPMRFSLSGGIAQPSGDLGDIANMGFTVVGSGDFRPANFPFGLRADASFTRWTGDEEEVGDDVSINLIGVQLNGVFRFQGQGGARSEGTGFRPYILGGVGAFRAAASDDGDSEDEIVLGFGFGGGLEFQLGTYTTFLEARYQTASTDDTIDDGISFIPITFGVRF